VKKSFKLILILSVFCLFGFDTVKLSNIINKSAKITDSGERIAYISSVFKNVPYKDNTLTGNSDEKEVLVINLKEMDCFTFLDYVEALRLSASPDDFVMNLKEVRYFNGEVTYKSRKHFFTDWVSGEQNSVKDITPELPGGITVEKFINRKSKNKNWLKNLPHTMRMITYIPSEKFDKDVLRLLQTGDYIGTYTDKQGLDVTHTGIFIRNEGGEFLRSASSKFMKVTDYPFEKYVNGVKGIIVLRNK